MFFLFSLVLNLAYIDYTLCQIWSAYMQYLRRCDHTDKCSFLVIQQAEVLLNLFLWIYDRAQLEYGEVGSECVFTQFVDVPSAVDAATSVWILHHRLQLREMEMCILMLI